MVIDVPQAPLEKAREAKFRKYRDKLPSDIDVIPLAVSTVGDPTTPTPASRLRSVVMRPGTTRPGRSNRAPPPLRETPIQQRLWSIAQCPSSTATVLIVASGKCGARGVPQENDRLSSRMPTHRIAETPSVRPSLASSISLLPAELPRPFCLTSAVVTCFLRSKKLNEGESLPPHHTRSQCCFP